MHGAVLAARAASAGAGMIPGRGCPLHYHYGARALAGAPAFEARTLLVAGGLYGNPFALQTLEDLAAAEDARLIFNGDFHWFDADAGAFDSVQARVLRHDAIAGNVEAELGEPSGAGCGCGYPPEVADAVVARSNAIMERLRGVATAQRRRQLAALPYYARARVGGLDVVVVHGDPESLAGWGLAVESMPTGNASSECAQRLASWFRDADADIFACTHTCLPHAARVRVDGRARAVVNNGSAGMPNFCGDVRGLVTRIATTPSARALYRAELNGVCVEALPLPFDQAAWRRLFRRWWPSASPARASYWQRIVDGPDHAPERALGPGVRWQDRYAYSGR